MIRLVYSSASGEFDEIIDSNIQGKCDLVHVSVVTDHVS